MKPTNDAIEHCGRHIERIRAEIQRREELRHDTERHRKRLKTLEALLAVHKATREPGTSRLSLFASHISDQEPWHAGARRNSRTVAPSCRFR